MQAPQRPDSVSEYRLARHLAARMVGLALAGIGVLMLLLTFVVAFTRLQPTALAVVALIGVLAVVALGAYAWRGLRLVRFDDVGYEVLARRGSGARSARWVDVKDAVTADVDGVPCVVIRLRDGRTTTIPVELLEADRDAFVTDLRDRLHVRDSPGRQRGR